MRFGRGAFGVGIIAALVGCVPGLSDAVSGPSGARGPSRDALELRNTTPRPAPSAPAVAEARPAAQATPASPDAGADRVLIATDPAVMAALEQSSAAFWRPFLPAAAEPVRSADLLAREPRYRVLAAQVRSEVERVRARDRAAGIGMRHAHRLFDPAWLGSRKMHFELIGVVNRIDRRWFAPVHCGETRLVYRLAYATEVRGQPVASRLPLTINVVFWQDADGAGCAEVAARWPRSNEADLAEALLAGPLAEHRLTLASLKSVELNFQLMRWPSTVRPALAGHAEYVLRAFHVRDQRLEAAPLENTPDVARLRGDGRLRAELLAWVRAPENLQAIDRGVAVLPERFAATAATSFSPHGLGRLANRPFRSLITPVELAGLPYEGLTVARSPVALLRRLDGMSCVGCHQSRSSAGFHLLGEERDARKLDALQFGVSAHVLGDLPRRQHELRALVAGQGSEPVVRELSEQGPQPEHRGPYLGIEGAHCGLGDPGLARYTCAPHLVCLLSGDAEMGSCTSKHRGSGDPCELATPEPDPSPYRDSASLEFDFCQRGSYCFTNRGGFPNGMCAGSCDRLDSRSACGLVPILGPFNECVAGGTPFTECIRKTADPAALRVCDAAQPCRDDYVCARGHDDRGVCLPTYFLFQLRVDGHDGI